MGRKYYVKSENIAVTAAQDIFQIKGATGKILKVTRVKWSNSDQALATPQMVATRCTFLPATVTDGSGGSSVTPIRRDVGDAAASFTCLTNNTTKASSNGTSTVQMEDSSHVFNGLDFPFANPVIVGPSESMVFELVNAPTGTFHLTAEAEVEEIGG